MTEQTLTPAQELRAAASKIREIAAKATPGPWMNHGNGDRIIRALPDGSDVLELDDSGRLEYVVDEPLIENPHNGEHIALWHPGVAELVAVLLVAAGGVAEEEGALGTNVEVVLCEELALARAINGGAR